MNKDLSYQIYSEFKASDWYIYWDKEASHTKDYQTLIVWHIKYDEGFVYYEFKRLKEMLKEGKAHLGLPYHNTLTTKSIEEFTSYCEEFVTDVDTEFDT